MSHMVIVTKQKKKTNKSTLQYCYSFCPYLIYVSDGQMNQFLYVETGKWRS